MTDLLSMTTALTEPIKPRINDSYYQCAKNSILDE